MSASRNHTFNFLEIQRPLKITLRGIFIRGDMLKRDGNRGISEKNTLRKQPAHRGALESVWGWAAEGPWGGAPAARLQMGRIKETQSFPGPGPPVVIQYISIFSFLRFPVLLLFHCPSFSITHFLRAYTYIHSRSE